MTKPTSRTLGGLIDELGRDFGDRPAVSFESETFSFSAFREMAWGCARALYGSGVRPGDKVGILMGNRPEWLAVAMGAQYLGATLVALNTWYTDRELSYVLEHGDVSLLVTAASFLRHDYIAMFDSLRPWSDRFPMLREIVVLGGSPTGDMIGYDAFLSRGASVADDVVRGLAAAVAPGDIAYILYTSGSTSRPKGVMLAHRGLIENMYEIGARLHFTPDDSLFLPVSLFWGMGCENGLLAAWTHASCVVLQHHFLVDEALGLLSRFQCTAVYGTGNIIQALFEHPRRSSYDLSALTKGGTGGTPEQIRSIIATLVPKACHAYGMTETYGFMTMSDAGDTVEVRSATHGRPLPGMELKIVDPETGTERPTGELGEARVRGYTMAGYYKSPDATNEAHDEYGFLKTGDLGYFDGDGNFHFRGRMKEMLKTGGLNVSPLEVEEIIRSHELVADAFVTGLPDPAREEIVAAVVVPVDGAHLTEAMVTDHCRRSLAAFKVPRRILVTSQENVPLTTTGKIHKIRLAEMFGSDDTPR